MDNPLVPEQWPPEHARPLVGFDVAGDPKGAGSKDAIPLGRWRVIDGQRRFIPVCREGGVPIVNVVDTSDKTGGPEWREQIRHACAQALDVAHELHDGPLHVRVIFYGEGPKSRYGTGRNAGRLKPHADRLPYRSELADGTKLARALEDALNGLCWTDDRRVCDLWWSRRFARHPGARVMIYTSPARFSDLPLEDAGVPGTLFDAGIRPDSSVIMESDGCDDDTIKRGPSEYVRERARRVAAGGAADWHDRRREAARDQGAELPA